MNFKKLTILFTLSSHALVSAQLQLTTESKISILTIGPGTSLNDAFGHTAIRIKDPIINLISCLIMDGMILKPKDFYLKFAQGKLDYEIGQI